MNSSPTALVILHEQFEELEAVAPIDILRRAGVRVTLASREFALTVKGRSGLAILAEARLDEALARAPYDAIVLPGGPGVVQRLRHDVRVHKLLRAQAARQGLIGAICAAPLVLLDAGLLPGFRYTAHPSARAELPGDITEGAVVEDGCYLTSPGAGTAVAFGLALAARLTSPAIAADLARSICA